MQQFLGEGLKFEELCVRWYNEGLVECHHNDEVGLTNGILRTYGYAKVGDTVESINTPPPKHMNRSAAARNDEASNQERDDSVDSKPISFSADF